MKATIRTGVLTLAISSAFLGAFHAAGRGHQPGKRAEFMRQKLEFSKQLLEGLTLEEFARIEKNGRALKILSQAAEWEDPIMPNPEEYQVYTNDFQRLCDDLRKNARDKNIDGATLAYVKLTMNCVACHKYVRLLKK